MASPDLKPTPSSGRFSVKFTLVRPETRLQLLRHNLPSLARNRVDPKGGATEAYVWIMTGKSFQGVIVFHACCSRLWFSEMSKNV